MFLFFLYRKVLKFWSKQTFGLECTCLIMPFMVNSIIRRAFFKKQNEPSCIKIGKGLRMRKKLNEKVLSRELTIS